MAWNPWIRLLPLIGVLLVITAGLIYLAYPFDNATLTRRIFEVLGVTWGCVIGLLAVRQLFGNRRP